MSSLVHSILNLKRKIFHRHHHLVPANGIPYVLGQGLTTPYVEPKITVHWHPPLTVTPAEEPVNEKTRSRSWFSRLGIRRRSG